MNQEQKRMVLVASGVRDRRQKIEWVWFGVGDLNEDGVTGGIEYGFMSFTTDRDVALVLETEDKT